MSGRTRNVKIALVACEQGEAGGSPDRAKKKTDSVLSVSPWLINKSGYRDPVSTVCGAKGIGVKKIRARRDRWRSLRKQFTRAAISAVV
jgi:hypothetical protein